MSKVHRVFAILGALKAETGCVTGQQLAKRFGVSLRTIYRDMSDLTQLGLVQGEAGVGYVLAPAKEEA